MKKEQLEYFLDVCETNSINESAKRLFISQPALTRAIQALEKECGQSFFERNNKGIYLNSVGKEFEKYAKDIVNSYGKAYSFIGGIMQFPGPLNILAAPVFSGQLFLEYLKECSSYFCNVLINYSENIKKYENQLSTVPNTMVFLAMSNNIKFPLKDNFEYIDLGEDEIYAFMSKENPISNQKEFKKNIAQKATAFSLINRTGEVDNYNYSMNEQIKSFFLEQQDNVCLVPRKIGIITWGDNEKIVLKPMVPPKLIRYYLIINPTMFSEKFLPVIEFSKKFFYNKLQN